MCTRSSMDSMRKGKAVCLRSDGGTTNALERQPCDIFFMASGDFLFYEVQGRGDEKRRVGVIKLYRGKSFLGGVVVSSPLEKLTSVRQHWVTKNTNAKTRETKRHKGHLIWWTYPFI